MVLNIITKDIVPYESALQMQYDVLSKRQAQEVPDTLILLEHPPTITLGRRAEDEHLIAKEEFLTRNGVTVHHIERGGEATYHGLGQLVGYTIVHIAEHFNSDVRGFVWGMEETFISMLTHEYGIDASRDNEHRGVWVDGEKILAVGIAIKRGVAMHGFALNVNTDLSHFNWIVPCGIRDRGVTSLEKRTGSREDMSVVRERAARYFAKTFGYDEVIRIAYENEQPA